ncbi:MAG: hypothetical protein HOO06_15925 [Bdellovibrionaceae bacterium]|jgi:uncharacterized protein YbjQ (UPF0145 family)|nr:hypothetical protein [Pseudobdellovibrionaceae bacterium]
MEKDTCIVCCTNKTAILCDSCDQHSCKHCCYFIDEDSFELFKFLPDSMRGKAFCPNCYNDNVADELEQFQEALIRAKDVDVYGVEQSSETRLMRRTAKLLKVQDCDDRKEALMHLAFSAARDGFKTIVDVDLKSTKVGKGTYKKLIWSGTAVPLDPHARR